MIQCPRGCTRPFVDALELYRHLRDSHRVPDYEARRLSGAGTDETGIKPPGWYEGQTETSSGMKARQHQIVQQKAQAAGKNTLSVPFMPTPTKPAVSLQENWKKTQTGFVYEHKVSEEHLTENVLTRIMRGEIVGNQATLVLYTYDKNIGDLSEAQSRASILSSRLAAYTVSDPEFSNIATELYSLKQQIQKEKQEIVPTKFQEIMLEDTYQGEDVMKEGDYETWASEFMQTANNTTESVSKELKKDDPIKL